MTKITIYNDHPGSHDLEVITVPSHPKAEINRMRIPVGEQGDGNCHILDIEKDDVLIIKRVD